MFSLNKASSNHFLLVKFSMSPEAAKMKIIKWKMDKRALLMSHIGAKVFTTNDVIPIS